MNSENEMKVIRDVSCTNSLHYDSELRAAGPNLLDFRSVMEKIRGENGLFFFLSLPHAYYSSLVFSELIVMSERLICFHIKEMPWKLHEPPEQKQTIKVMLLEKIRFFERSLLNIQHMKKHRQDVTNSN